MAPIPAGKRAASCAGCYAWGQLPGRYCHACYTYAQLHALGVCTGCRRSVTVDEGHGYCRLCRAQATWAIQACGNTGTVLAPFLARVGHQQLFLANLQKPRHGGPLLGKGGHPRRARQPWPPAQRRQLSVGWVQMELFTAVQDFNRVTHGEPAAAQRGEQFGETQQFTVGVTGQHHDQCPVDRGGEHAVPAAGLSQGLCLTAGSHEPGIAGIGVT